MNKEIKKRVNIILSIIMFFLLATTLVYASATKQGGGTAVDFTVAYPWLVIGLLAILFSLVIKLVNKYDTQREGKINGAIEAIAKTNESQIRIANKIDKTLNTLFDRDHERGKQISEHAVLMAKMQERCDIRSELCLGLTDRRRKNGLQGYFDEEKRKE